MEPSRRSMLHRYAVATAAATWLLLIAGGLVTSTGSGLAVPDWPLSYGTWWPPMVGGIAYEHGHRMVAALAGLMIAVLSLWLWRAEPRRWVRRLGLGALAAVILQAILGGLTVLLLLPPKVSIAHACLGQAVFCLVACVAWATAPRWEDHPSLIHDGSLPPWPLVGVVLPLLAALQLVLGAIIRHTGADAGWHVAGALALALAVFWTVARLAKLRRRLPTLWAHGCSLLGLLIAQIIVGLAVFGHRGSVALRTGHLALGALVLAQAVVLGWETVRRLRVVIR